MHGDCSPHDGFPLERSLSIPPRRSEIAGSRNDSWRGRCAYSRRGSCRPFCSGSSDRFSRDVDRGLAPRTGRQAGSRNRHGPVQLQCKYAHRKPRSPGKIDAAGKRAKHHRRRLRQGWGREVDRCSEPRAGARRGRCEGRHPRRGHLWPQRSLDAGTLGPPGQPGWQDDRADAGAWRRGDVDRAGR